jgi:hypothetical protein
MKSGNAVASSIIRELRVCVRRILGSDLHSSSIMASLPIIAVCLEVSAHWP